MIQSGRFTKPLLVLLTLAILPSSTLVSAEQLRFQAMLFNGTIVDGKTLQNWYDDKTPPVLDKTQIFNKANPIRWLMDREKELPQTPKAYVEFVGGDRLPGKIIGHRSGSEDPFHWRESHLLVEPSIDLTFPGRQWDVPLRVGTRWLKRVVWESRGGASIPSSTVLLKDGRQFKFRSLRWRKEGVALLLENGIQQFPFATIAEIHFPARDAWQSYYEQVAVLTPETDSHLLQIETVDGLRATTSMQRFQAHFSGDKRKPESWLQTVQPAWSLDPICVHVTHVWMWRYFTTFHVPLTLIAPTNVKQESTFGSGWRWQMNRSVTGEILETANRQYGWGFGVHAMCEMQFPISAAANTFRSRIGLEQSVGKGGCAKGIVTISSKPDAPIYQTDVMIGTANFRDSGHVSVVGPDQTQQFLTLTADPVIEGRPQGADPFDIRDSVNWLEPEFHLDHGKFKVEVANQWATNLALGDDWEIEGQFSRMNYWDTTYSTDPRYKSWILPKDKFITFRSEIDFDRNDSWLSVLASRPIGDFTPSHCIVSVDGKALAEFEIALRVANQEPQPVTIPVHQFRGKSAVVEITQIPTDPKSWVDWQAIAVTAEPPGLKRVFEDEERFVNSLKHEDNSASVDEDSPHTGDSAIKVLTPMVTRERLSEPVVIRNTPTNGQFRYIRFAWKKVEGDTIGFELGHDGSWGAEDENPVDVPIDRNQHVDEIRRRNGRAYDVRGNNNGFRYDAGSAPTEYKKQVRLSSTAPKDWTVLTRDLFTDFGDFKLTGIRLRNFAGEALFDHIYLARTSDDFRYIDEMLKPFDTPPEDAPNVLARTLHPLRWGTLISRVAPGFSARVAGINVEIQNDFRGRDNVLVTHPVQQNTPCILRSAIVVPKEKKTRLEMTVSHKDEADWQLIVKANGNQLHSSLVNAAAVKDTEGWLDVNVDLSGLAGQRVMLEVHNHSNNWANEFAYWHQLKIVSE